MAALQNTESAEGGNIEVLKSEGLYNSTFLVRYSIFKAVVCFKLTHKIGWTSRCENRNE
jgi:hypothetical protein